MNLARREKTMLFGVLAILLLWGLDQYVLTPLWDRQDELQLKRGQIQADIARDQKLFSERKQLKPKWKGMLESGLKRDPAEAEGQLLHALRDWARDSGLSLSSIKPDRPESKSDMKEVLVQAAGSATMDSIARFLWQLQSSSFPLKVTDLQISARNDDSSELVLQVKVSTLYYAPEKRGKTEDERGKSVEN